MESGHIERSRTWYDSTINAKRTDNEQEDGFSLDQEGFDQTEEEGGNPFSFDRFEAFENVTETTKKSLVQPVFVQEDLVHRPPTSALGVQDLLRAGLLHGLLLQPLLQ